MNTSNSKKLWRLAGGLKPQSFVILVYASCWLKRHKPAAFAAALINSQPMGFYQPAQIVRDAQAHGVTVRPIDINHSQWDCTLERSDTGHDIRLGTRLVKGLVQGHAEALAGAVGRHGSFDSLDSLWRSTRSEVPIEALRHLARADAFASMGVTRQAALWTLQRLRNDPMPLFDAFGDDAGIESDAKSARHLPPRSAFDEVIADYDRAHLSLKAHPVSFARTELENDGCVRCEVLQDAARCPNGRVVSVGGLVLVRQRPGTASGIVFMTIEDETGIANLVLFPQVFERFRGVARHSAAVICTGNIERQGQVVHVKVQQIKALELNAIDFTSRDFH